MEELITDSHRFFDTVISQINQAQKSIDCEIYILAPDDTGNRVFNALLVAANRGVLVRLLVDGVGSSSWLSEHSLDGLPHNFVLKIYHPIPFIGYPFRSGDKLNALMRAFTRLNRRNHRKLMVVDDQHVFIGSHNYCDSSLEWNEVSVHIRGSCQELIRCSELFWSRTNARSKFVKRKFKRRSEIENTRQVQSNITRRARRSFLRNLIVRIRQAEHKVWLITPYFVPPSRLLKVLRASSEGGKDVRLVLPKKNDHYFMRVAARYYYPLLLQSGVTIYEYEPTMLHAKIFLIDDWVAIGSTNLNHRSFFYDLELLVTLFQNESRKQAEHLFDQTFRQSELIDNNSGFQLSLFEKIFSRLTLTFRNWL